MFDQEHFKQISIAYQEQLRFQAEKSAAEEHEKRLEATIRVLSALYDRAAAYTNVVIIAGYAVVFAVWTNMKPGLTRKELLWSGLSLLFSAIVFIFWECSVMIYNAENLKNFSKVLDAIPSEFDSKLKLAQSIECKRNIRIRRFWLISLILTIFSGAAGGAILIGSFIRQLVSAA